MRSKFVLWLQVIAMIAGLFAGFVGGLHGYYEIKHGNTVPGSLVYDAISGNALTADNPHWTGWPAMSLVPDFLATGIIAVGIAVFVIGWTILCLNRPYGGIGLILLSIVLCLFGGGFVPPLVGVLGGIIGVIGNKKT